MAKQEKSNPDTYLSRYRGFGIRIRHPRPGVCVGELFDPMHPTDRPEMIMDQTAREVVDFAVRWIDGVYLEEAGRVERAIRPKP
jgi:hypothetical protein